MQFQCFTQQIKYNSPRTKNITKEAKSQQNKQQALQHDNNALLDAEFHWHGS